jgi:hypothetical protein
MMRISLIVSTKSGKDISPVTPVISALFAAGWLALVSVVFWLRRKLQVARS